jgi:hypothetical protein
MYRKFLPLSITFFLVVSIFSKSHSQVKFGLKWGYNVPFVQGDMGWSKDIFSLKYPTDVITGHAGLSLMIPIGKVFAIQPEVLYSKTAYSYYDPYTMSDVLRRGNDDLDWIQKELKNYSADWTDSFHYLSAPLLFKARIKQFGIFAGPQYDYLVKTTLQYYNSGIDGVEKQNHDENYQMGSHFSVVGGLDYTMRFGLGFNVRYQRGLTRVDKVSPVGIFSEDNIMKNDILMVGMHFMISKKRRQ